MVSIVLMLVASCSSTEVTLLNRGVSVARRGASMSDGPLPVPTYFLLPNPTLESDSDNGVAVNGFTSETFVYESEGLDAVTLEECSPEVNREFESSLISNLNILRSKMGLPLLTEQSQLNQIARSHSLQMACQKFFSHIDPKLGSPEKRVTQGGYNYSAIGEVIAAGHFLPEDVLGDWLASEAHKKILFGTEWTQVGVGYVSDENSEHGYYWTVLVGTP